MAQRYVDQEAFSCSICLDLLKDPVTVPCGHSYCRKCVTNHWDQEDERKLYSCPQCRQRFRARPELVKNIMLADLAEQLKTGLAVPSADYAGAQDVSCDVCTDRKLKAVKSCVQCLASYCERHLQTHYDTAVLQRHQLVAPSHKLQVKFCSKHNREKELFCRSEQQFICSLCVDHHQGHHIVSSASERSHRQQQLLHSLQLKETELKHLLQEAEDISRSAKKAVQRTGHSFTEMILLLEKRRSEVEQQIRSEEQTLLRRVRELQDQLQQDVTELKRSISDQDSLWTTVDHFVQLCSAVPTHTQRDHTVPHTYFEDVTTAVSVLSHRLRLALEEDLRPGHVSVPEPSSRADFLQYYTELTWDSNSVNPMLSLSDGNRRATVMSNCQDYPEHPDRFTYFGQVLSRESLTGRCYWELKFKGEWVHIAVSYRNIKRKEECDIGFGQNDKSWALDCNKKGYSFNFNSVHQKVSGSYSSRIGVYLDHGAGTLSFYSINKNSMTLLHRAQTTFTQPLYAGIWLNWYFTGTTAGLCKLK